MTFQTTAQMIDSRSRGAAQYRLRQAIIVAWLRFAATALALIFGFIATQIILELALTCASTGNCIIPPYSP